MATFTPTKELFYAALELFEDAVVATGRKFEFTDSLKPENNQFAVRSRRSGAYLRCDIQGSVVRFETSYRKGSEQIGGFDIDFGATPDFTLDQIAECYLKAGVTRLAELVCMDVYEDSRSLLMA